MKKATVILPTYNEGGTIEKLIIEIFAQEKKTDWIIDVLVVDSNSSDQTAEKVRNLSKTQERLHLLETKKEGLGRAYIKGFTFALDHINPEIVFEMDADYSHDPKKIPEFLKKIDEGADFVIGSRYIRGGSIPKNWSLDRKIFSVIGNLVIRFGFMKLKISDWTSGYRAVKASLVNQAIPKIQKYSGYVFQVALLDEALKKNVQIAEIPIHFADRIFGVSKINSFEFMFQTLFYIFAHSSFIKYAIVGVISAIVDFGLSFFFIEKLYIAIWLSTLVSGETSIVANFLLNNFWSFSHKKLESKKSVYAEKFLKFNLIQSGSILIQVAGIHFLAVLFGERLWLIYKFFITGFVVVPYSYILYNKVIWKK